MVLIFMLFYVFLVYYVLCYVCFKPYAGTQQNIATPVGYILPSGQTVTFLTPSKAYVFVSVSNCIV